MRAYIADDNAEVRSALRLLLERKLGHQVVGVSDRVAELVQVVSAARAQLLLIDGELSGVDRVLLAQLRNRCPALRIILLSCDVASDSLAAGVDACVYKGDPAAKVTAAIAAAVSSSSRAA